MINKIAGDICAAKYDADGCWYRAKVEKVHGKEAHILFIDYGNREITETSKLASLPSAFQGPAPYALEYGVAFARLPPDVWFKCSILIQPLYLQLMLILLLGHCQHLMCCL